MSAKEGFQWGYIFTKSGSMKIIQILLELAIIILIKKFYSETPENNMKLLLPSMLVFSSYFTLASLTIITINMFCTTKDSVYNKLLKAHGFVSLYFFVLQISYIAIVGTSISNLDVATVFSLECILLLVVLADIVIHIKFSKKKLSSISNVRFSRNEDACEISTMLVRPQTIDFSDEPDGGNCPSRMFRNSRTDFKAASNDGQFEKYVLDAGSDIDSPREENENPSFGGEGSSASGAEMVERKVSRSSEGGNYNLSPFKESDLFTIEEESNEDDEDVDDKSGKSVSIFNIRDKLKVSRSPPKNLGYKIVSGTETEN